jgi:hypothetical protein
MANHVHPIYDQESTYTNFFFTGGLFGAGVHEHGMPHEHTVPDHSHPHDHEVPSQEIILQPHQHNIPEHAHTLDYGIYYSDAPDGLAVKLDGTTIPDLEDRMYMNDFDLLPFIRKDVNGRPQVGWHELKFFATDVGGSTGSVSGSLFTRKFLATSEQ